MFNFVDTQKWVPVHTLQGYEACIEYHINREGKVKSTKGKVERILKQKISNNGYPTVNLTQRVTRGKILTVCVHTLVALAFLGPPPTPLGRTKGCTLVDHKDDDKLNNNADNLQWCSRKFNNTKRSYKRRPKNTPEQQAAAKERQKISKREYMRRVRAKDKEAKIEESLIENHG